MRKSSFITGIVLATLVLLPVMLAAQETPKTEIFGGYTYLRNSGVQQGLLQDFLHARNGMNGWEAQATFNLNRNFGLTGDVSGNYRNLLDVSGTLGLPVSSPQRVYNFLAGPTVTARFGKTAVFGHGLFGVAHSTLGATLPFVGTTGVSSATGFAMALGGGIDVGVTDHFAIRVAQVDYLYTRFNALDALSTGLSTGTAGHQNNFRYSGGIVIRF